MRNRLTCFVQASVAGFLLVLTSQQLAAQATISGKITTPLGDPMPRVVIDIIGTVNDFVITDSAGKYTATLPTGGAYSLIPHCNRNPLNGVTTFDMVLIWRHYDNIEPLNTPFEIIAADINNDGLLTTLDTIQGRRLILGVDTAFQYNSSWRFIRSDYFFPDPANPFQPPFPETYTTSNLTADVSANFYGIKIGDVNHTAVAEELTDLTHLSWIVGTVAKDQNSNCLVDAAEPPLQGWLVKAISTHGTAYTRTQADGQYTLGVPPATHSVVLIAPNSYWSPCDDTLDNITTTHLTQTTADIPVQVETECPYLTVDLAALFLRRCFENTYSVQYCNQGTVPAEDAWVEVTFDSFLQVTNSSIPWTAVNGNTYTFALGDVGVNACGYFQVTVLVDCEAELGQTHCSSAHIYPDTLCTPPNAQWNGADLEVTGFCDDGDVVFQIKNNGAAMNEPVEYVVIEDIMIQMAGNPIQLGSGQTQTVATIPGNGSTWRLEVEQPAFHPWSTLAAAWVEGCGTGGSGTHSTGFVTQFPLGDENPAVDVDCIQNVSSFDPNDKQGLPAGDQDEHYVPRGQEMTYKIRFQNTGTDTAFNVMIRDTLSAYLDPATLRVGAGSHPFTYQLLGEGVLIFDFQNILLPDSNVNEPASHGFVQFKIRPRPDTPLGTDIFNTASIYFDFNAPVVTNSTRHRLGRDFYTVSIDEPDGNLLVPVQVRPNPFHDHTRFVLPESAVGRYTFRLYDATGRLLRTAAFNGPVLDFSAGELPGGLYWLELRDEGGQAVASGKLVRQR